MTSSALAVPAPSPWRADDELTSRASRPSISGVVYFAPDPHDEPAVAAADRVGPTHSGLALNSEHIPRLQEAVGEVLKARHCRAVGVRPAESLHGQPAVERRRLASEPVRPAEVACELAQLLTDKQRTLHHPTGQLLKLGAAQTELGGHRAPLQHELSEVDLLLLRTRLERRLLRRPRRIRAPLGHRLDDLRAPLGEVIDHRPRDPLDLRRAISDRVPLDPQVLRQPRSQLGLIEAASGLGLLEQGRTVERDIAPVLAPLGEVRHHGVGVQLRIKGAARAVAKHRADEPLPRLLAALAAVARPDNAGLALHVAKRRLNGLVVSLAHRRRDLLAAEVKQQRRRLRRREGHVHPLHRLVADELSQHPSRPRVDGLHHDLLEVAGLDHSLEPERRGALTKPLSWRLALAGVVVVAALRHRGGVVARAAPVAIATADLA